MEEDAAKQPKVKSKTAETPKIRAKKKAVETEAPSKSTNKKPTETKPKTPETKPTPNAQISAPKSSESKGEVKQSPLQRAARLGLPVKSAEAPLSVEILGTGSTAVVESIPESKKLDIRAERFQTTEFKLKQRKERFGEEAFLSEAELTAKRRRERFGTVNDTATGKRANDTTSDEQTLKKRQRLERFGPVDGNPLDPLAVKIRAERFGIVTKPKTSKKPTPSSSRPKSRKSPGNTRRKPNTNGRRK